MPDFAFLENKIKGKFLPLQFFNPLMFKHSYYLGSITKYQPGCRAIRMSFNREKHLSVVRDWLSGKKNKTKQNKNWLWQYIMELLKAKHEAKFTCLHATAQSVFPGLSQFITYGYPQSCESVFNQPGELFAITTVLHKKPLHTILKQQDTASPSSKHSYIF